MGYIKRLAGQTAIYGLSSVVPRLLNYLLVPLYTRVLVPEEFGVLTEMYAYLAFLLVLLTFGFETGYFRFSTVKKEESNESTIYSTAFYTLLFTSTLFIIIAHFYSTPIVSFLGYPNNPEYIKYLSVIIGLDAFCSIPFAKLRLDNRPFTFSSIKIAGVVTNVMLNLFFLVLCPKVPSLANSFIYNPDLGITYIFISNMVSSILVTVVLLVISYPSSFLFKTRELKALLLYSIPLLISGLGGTTNESFDRIFIKFLVPADQNPLYQLGIYGSNIKLAVLMILFIQMYRYAAEPFFFSTSNQDDSKQIYADMLKYFLIFCIFIFLCVGLFTDILKFIVGSEFREGLSIVPILLFANILYGVFFNLSIWYKLTHRTWYGIYYTFAGAIITVALNFILIPRIGYYGAAIARLFCYSAMCILCYYGGKKYFPIPYNIPRLSLFFISGLILFFLGYFILIPSLILSFLFRFTIVTLFIAIVLFTEKISPIALIKSLVKW